MYHIRSKVSLDDYSLFLMNWGVSGDPRKLGRAFVEKFYPDATLSLNTMFHLLAYENDNNQAKNIIWDHFLDLPNVGEVAT